ncbi:glycosyltransferase [Saccharospirillum impatiens]|uniref:glycosyltransferase n=1 Tax=Saccharospirillum impatiens TaxID=169438 RepID=UPI00041FE4CD|nr:glycosyltransferase [Saccharospirillum impatiens]
MSISRSTEKIRVLHIISGDLWAGAEAQAYALIKQLNKDCTVAAVLMNEGELATRLRAIDIPVTVLDETRLSALRLFQGLRKAIKAFRPTVIHTHRQKENILGSLSNLTTLRARCVRTVHGASEFDGGLKTRIQRWADTACGRWLQDGVIVVSQELMDKLQGQYGAQKLYCVPNGVDLEELNEKANAGTDLVFEPDCIHIAIIGRLVPVKRVDLFLEAARLVLDRSNNYRFHIVGDGPLEVELKTQASLLNLVEPNVQFHGHRSDIPAIIKKSDAVILCSDHEGMPMVALETLCLKTTLINTDTVHLEQNGIATERQPIVQSANDLAKAILNLRPSNDQPTLKDKNFELTVDICAQKTLRVYCNKLLAEYEPNFVQP